MNLLPGDIGMSTINGHTGAFVRLGQLLYGAGKYAKWTHVFTVGGGDDVYQAMPRGFEKASLAGYVEEAKHDDILWIHVPLTDEQRAGVIAAAEDLVARKVGYSFASYLRLFLKRLGLNTDWLRKAIADSGDQICSQTVDYCLTATGFKVFDDGRDFLDVIPADFARLVDEDPRFTVI